MEKLIEYIFTHLDKNHSIALVLAFVFSFLEAKALGWRNCFIVAILAVGIAGAAEDYLPAHTIFISIIIGIVAGICTDDLYTKFVSKFPTFLDEISSTFIDGVKAIINRWTGNKKDE